MQITLNSVFAAVVFVSVCIAADKPDFSGTWRQETPAGEPAPVLEIKQSDTEFRVSTAAGQPNASEVTCNMVGKQCQALIDGEKVAVSYWFNGPTLIEMAIEGKNNDRVTETRRTLSEDGRTMLVEVIPIVPAGDSRKVVFKRD